MICEDLSRYIIHTCIQIHTYIAYITYITYLHSYIHTHIRTYILTYILTYIQTYRHTHTWSYIYIYISIYDVECVKGIVWSMQFQLGNFEHIAFVYICGGFIHLVQLVTGHLAVQKKRFFLGRQGLHYPGMFWKCWRSLKIEPEPPNIHHIGTDLMMKFDPSLRWQPSNSTRRSVRPVQPVAVPECSWMEFSVGLCINLTDWGCITNRLG